MRIKFRKKIYEPKLEERHLFIGLAALAISISIVLTSIISSTIVITDRGYVFQSPFQDSNTIIVKSTGD